MAQPLLLPGCPAKVAPKKVATAAKVSRSPARLVHPEKSCKSAAGWPLPLRRLHPRRLARPLPAAAAPAKAVKSQEGYNPLPRNCCRKAAKRLPLLPGPLCCPSGGCQCQAAAAGRCLSEVAGTSKKVGNWLLPGRCSGRRLPPREACSENRCQRPLLPQRLSPRLQPLPSCRRPA